MIKGKYLVVVAHQLLNHVAAELLRRELHQLLQDLFCQLGTLLEAKDVVGVLDGVIAERTLNQHFNMLHGQSQELGSLREDRKTAEFVHEDL